MLARQATETVGLAAKPRLIRPNVDGPTEASDLTWSAMQAVLRDVTSERDPLSLPLLNVATYDELSFHHQFLS
jgi:hypothetical protein